jgi:hypothetical protein
MNEILWTISMQCAHTVRRLKHAILGRTGEAIAIAALLAACGSSQEDVMMGQELVSAPQESGTGVMVDHDDDDIAPVLDSVEVSGGGTVDDVDGALPDGVEECLQEWFQVLESQQAAMPDQDYDVQDDGGTVVEHRPVVEVAGGIVGEVSAFGDFTGEVPQDVYECMQEWAFQVSQNGAVEQEGATEREYSSPSDIDPEVDPVAVALGLTSKDEVHALYSLEVGAEDAVQAAVALHPELIDLLNGTIAGSDVSDEARAAVDDSAFRVVAAHSALEPAVEALYEGLSKTEEAFALLNEWRRCMARSGYDYDSPAEIETALTGRSRNIDSIPDLLAARDQCLAEVDYAGASDRAVLQVMPEWKSEHAALLTEYREALESYERGLPESG